MIAKVAIVILLALHFDISVIFISKQSKLHYSISFFAKNYQLATFANIHKNLNFYIERFPRHFLYNENIDPGWVLSHQYFSPTHVDFFLFNFYTNE